MDINFRIAAIGKLFVLGFGLLLANMAAPASAICFNGVIASYEPDEGNDLIVCPNSFSRVPGGVNGAPEATEGAYVLKLTWADETDHKIEARHTWSKSTFDLSDANYILADVYFETESALPAPDENNISIWSRWDSNDYWITCESVPPKTGEWYTVGFNVGDVDCNNVNNIDALIFENLAGTEGTMYIDNLRILRLSIGYGEWPHIRRKIKFSECWWSVLQSDDTIGAGPNRYTDDANDVWVDPSGHLHLSIVQKDANWYCSEVVENANRGNGTYIFTVKNEIDSQDPNIILGLFIYDVPDGEGNHREIDVELTRWGNPDDPNNAQFVVQPWYHAGNVHRFRVGYGGTEDRTTYEVTWLADAIDFRSYYGEAPLRDPDDIIETWSYEDINGIPAEGCENARINFYLMDGNSPAYGQNAEVVIKSFQHVGNIAANVDMRCGTINLLRRMRRLTCLVRLGEGVNIADIEPSCVFLEERIKAGRISFNARKQTATITFEGSEVRALLAERGESGNIPLSVRGQLKDGTRFKGTDTVRVIRGKAE